MASKFEKLLEKKKAEGKELSDTEKHAKGKVLKELSDMAGDAMGDHLGKGLKKVTVAAPSKKGLEKGLDVAKGIMQSPMGEMMDKETEELGHEEKESPEHEEAESPEYEAGEEEAGAEEAKGEMGDEEHEALKELESVLESPEEVDAMIAELEKIKEKLSKKEV